MTITALPAAPSRSSPADFSNKADALLGALSLFVTEANALAVALNLASTTANSTTSLTIGTGSKSLTVDTSKSYQPGMSVKIARTASPSNWMHGDVTSYNSGTGALVVNVTTILGSGTFTDWTITLSAPIITPDPIVLPTNHISGLGLSHAADTDHDITVAAGKARDATDAADMVLASALTKQFDAAWAVGTAAGGMAAGEALAFELMILDVAPGGAGWAAGDTITGQTSAQTCVIAKVLTTTTYYVINRSGAFTLGEILTNGVDTADQGAANPTFAVQTGTLHLWLIKRSDTGVVDMLGNIYEISGIVPTLPANYDYKRRIGSLRTDSSANILGFDQFGNTFMLDTPIMDIRTTNSGTAAVSRTLSVPGGISVGVYVSVYQTGFIYISSLASADVAPDINGTANPLSTASNQGGMRGPIMSNTLSQVRSRSSSDEDITIVTLGWEDTRGAE